MYHPSTIFNTELLYFFIIYTKGYMFIQVRGFNSYWQQGLHKRLFKKIIKGICGNLFQFIYAVGTAYMTISFLHNIWKQMYIIKYLNEILTPILSCYYYQMTVLNKCITLHFFSRKNNKPVLKTCLFRCFPN